MSLPSVGSCRPARNAFAAACARGARRDSRARAAARRVAILTPQTYMNDAGRSVGPARGALKVPLDHVLVIHDEIDLPFGQLQLRTGGGLAGHNGLKSIKRELGSPEFARLRVGVGRPDSTDPEVVSAWVLGRFSEGEQAVRTLVRAAADEVERTVLGDRAPEQVGA